MDVIEIISDAVKDALILVPILFLMHILIELVERRAGHTSEKFLRGPLSPLIGTMAGILPQCGFSVVATNLYCKRRIPLGTLLAVYIATSDEAIPILLSSPQSAVKLLPLLAIKIVAAVAAGYAVNFVSAQRGKTKARSLSCESLRTPLQGRKDCLHKEHPAGYGYSEFADEYSLKQHTDGCAHKEHTNQCSHRDHIEDCNHEKDCRDEPCCADGVLDAAADGHSEVCVAGCHRHHIVCDHKESVLKYLWHPLRHTAEIFVFILVINIILGFLVQGDALTDFMAEVGIFQPLLAALVGLIPNCAASVTISRLYALGHLSLGGAVAGLSVSAGLGYAVLVKENKNRLETVLIICGMFVFGVLLGMAVNLLPF